MLSMRLLGWSFFPQDWLKGEGQLLEWESFPQFEQHIIVLSVLDAALNWWRRRRLHLLISFGQPDVKPSRVGQDGKAGQCGWGKRNSKFEIQKCAG